jgi:hypothetical protein
MPELSNFDISSCQDLSSGWKTTTLGGGCKTTEFFCPQCMVSRKTVEHFKVDTNRCSFCTKLGITRCYCRAIVDDNTLDSIKATLQKYIETAMDDGFQRLDRITKESEMEFDSNVAVKDITKYHIDFQPKSTKDHTAFSRILNQELKIRIKDRDRLHNLMNLLPDEKREVIREFGAFESSIQLARFTVRRHETARSLAISLAVEKFIPCILHMKMRVVEKVFHTLINSGLQRYGESQVDKKTCKLLAANIELCMKNEIIGNEERNITCQWKFTWSKSKKGCTSKPSMEKPNLSGNQSQKVINKLRRIVEVLFHPDLDQDCINKKESATKRRENEALQGKWYALSDTMVNMWTLIEQHDDYNDDQLDNLHLTCSSFMNQWIDITGPEHITNYIHILGASHVTYFARKYRNLYRYSQQGWESLNQLIKHFYFNNTNHGGSAGNGGKNAVGQYDNGTISGDHCRPLMRLCQRSIMWKLGLGDAYFRNIMNTGCHSSSVEIDMDIDDDNEEEDGTILPIELQYGIL